MALKKSNTIYPDDVQGIIAEIDALPPGKTVNNIDYFQVEGKYYRRVVNGIKRAVECGIKTDGSNQASHLQALLDSDGESFLLDIPGDIILGSSVDGRGKTLHFENGCRLSGTGALTNVRIAANPEEVIFDLGLQVTGLLNTEISFGWWTLPGVNATLAAQRVSTVVNSMTKVHLSIPKGEYTMGLQTLRGNNAGSSSYFNQPMFAFQNNDYLEIEGNGATFKVASGLHFGTFDPLTGAPVTHSLPYDNQSGDAAQIGKIFHLANNKQLILRNITVDGNLQNLVIGGPYGDTGWQLDARGFNLDGNTEVYAENCIANYNGLDGFSVQTTVTAKNQAIKPHTFINCTGIGNGRLGISWTGGNHLFLSNCRFNNNGRTVNSGTGQEFTSSPASGFDNEAEAGNITINGLAENCEFVNNKNSGALCEENAVSSLGFSWRKCKFVGTVNWATYIRRAGHHFTECLFVGPIAGAYSATSFEDPNRTIFNNCQFSFDAALSPTGVVYLNSNDGQSGFLNLGDGTGNYAEFNNCTFDGAQNGLNPYTSGTPVSFTDCTFSQTKVLTSFTRAYFYGRNHFKGQYNDFSFSKIYGPVFVDGVMINQMEIPGNLKIGGTADCDLLVHNNTNGSYFSSVSDNLSVSLNRRPLDGVFLNNTRGAATVDLVGHSAGAYFQIATSNAAGTNPSTRVIVTETGIVQLITSPATASGNYMLLVRNASGGDIQQVPATLLPQEALLTTASATPATIATIVTQTNTSVEIYALYIGHDSSNNEISRFAYSYLVKNIGGTLTIVNTAAVYGGASGSFGGSIPTPTVSGTSLLLRVQGNTNNIYWKVNYTTTTLTPIL